MGVAKHQGPLCKLLNGRTLTIRTPTERSLIYGNSHIDLIRMSSKARGPNDHINNRILRTMVSGTPLILGLRTSMRDPCDYTISYTIFLYYTIL